MERLFQKHFCLKLKWNIQVTIGHAAASSADNLTSLLTSSLHSILYSTFTSYCPVEHASISLCMLRKVLCATNGEHRKARVLVHSPRN